MLGTKIWKDGWFQAKWESKNFFKILATGGRLSNLGYHAERWNDRERLAEGRSIGSGQVEGACLLGLQKSGPDRQTLETNRCPMTHQKSPQHGNPLRRTLRKPMEFVLE